jgi:cytochrome c peroxidase
MKSSKGSLAALLLPMTLVATFYVHSTAIAESSETIREGTCHPNPFPDVNPPPGSLKHIPVPTPPQLKQFVRNKDAAIALGKSLFWDMRVGSDGIQSCASCHFRAGADPRSRNSLSPGGANLKNRKFELGGPNYQLSSSDFPLHKLKDPTNRHSQVIHDFNDVVSSQGIQLSRYHSTVPGDHMDRGVHLEDYLFQIGDKNSRRVPERNTPTVINAAFNRRNFWDGRAEEVFNGVNPFGVRDPKAHVLEALSPSQLKAVKVRITNASLASQAVGPPVNDVEMGFVNRSFPDVGKRLLPALALERQVVHPNDSVLGPYAKSRMDPSMTTGLAYSYEELITQAFDPKWWKSDLVITITPEGSHQTMKDPGRPLKAGEYRLMEYNFSLFFGLAIQLYESTLISDDAPIDRYFDGQKNAITSIQRKGLALFEKHACAACHAGAEFTNASSRILNGANGEPGEFVERMMNGNCETVAYDQSFYNIGVRPYEEDLGIGADDPYGNPLSLAKLLTMDPAKVNSPELLSLSVPNIARPPLSRGERISTQGAFKVPSLRNISLTAPYFHNGGQATLRQVLEFYNRGGDFREHNSQFIDFEIGKLGLTENEIDEIVAFLESLTDERVVKQQAPFDHPQLFVPNGHRGHPFSGEEPNSSALDDFLEIPAVGKEGGPLPLGFLE